MDPSVPAIIATFIPLVAVIGGIGVAIASIVSKSRIRELQIRERIAMIEKGLVPPPEVDPGGFELAMNYVEHRGRPHAKGRQRRGGVMLLGLGFGLMVLIGFTAQEPAVAIGVGGFVVIFGFALLFNSLFEPTAPARWSAPHAPDVPPGSPHAGS